MTESTIIVGDINTNPYEYTCLGADTFHGIPFCFEAQKKNRIVDGKTYKMFYNPMWKFLGSHDVPFGTYYFSSYEYECSFWNIYDQLLIRPGLIDKLKEDSIKIITTVGNESLLDDNKHPNEKISDHLPLFFEIEV